MVTFYRTPELPVHAQQIPMRASTNLSRNQKRLLSHQDNTSHQRLINMTKTKGPTPHAVLAPQITDILYRKVTKLSDH